MNITMILCSMGIVTLKNYSTIAFDPIRMSVMKNVTRTRSSVRLLRWGWASAIAMYRGYDVFNIFFMR